MHAAYLMAKEAHKGQTRNSGEPFITHPIAVAYILATIHLDYQSIAAALLHDVIEDTKTTKQSVLENFGEEVANLVDGVTKLTQIKFKTKLEEQAANFRKMLLAMSKDIRVIIIKLADRLHNMRTIQSLPYERRRRVTKETLEIYSPIAKRLGMHDIALELEELCFISLYPTRYRILLNSVTEVQKDHHKVLNKISKKIQQCLEEHSILNHEISGREKHVYSIYKKMRDKKIPFSEIMDVYALRICVNSIDCCYRVLGLIHQLYKPMPKRFKDYIALPKPNGYQSLHTILFGPYGAPIEIQIRTTTMDNMANNGIAAHWLYKSGSKKSSLKEMKNQQWLNDLIEMQKKTGNSVEFIENVKVDLYPNEVYVFTPNGDIVTLPTGATVLDFAYTVHTDIGHTCVAAKLDKQWVSLSTNLVNAQTVEIINKTDVSPNPVWLNWVVTTKAKNSIRAFLKSKNKAESIALGKRLLSKSLTALSMDYDSLNSLNLLVVAKKLLYENMDQLLEDIGLGNRPAAFVCQQIKISSQYADGIEKKDTVEEAPLIITGAEGLVVKCASCCLPIPGDTITGILKAGQGVEIHRQNCRKINKRLQKSDQLIWVQWAKSVEGEFKINLHVDVLNRRGALAMIALAISEAKANINDVIVDDHDPQMAKILLSVNVTGRVQLANAIRLLRRLSVVVKVYRSGE